MHDLGEAQLLTVEGNRGIHIVDDVADAHCGRSGSPPSESTRASAS